MSKSDAAQNAISLPKGGGALKGIGETFQPNLFSGTGNYSVPIAVSPGRNGFGPTLSLQYSSGNGNGSFGIGWQLTIPRITRKTERGLPQYDDTDLFVMSGAEDLVPCLKKAVNPDSGEDAWRPEDPIIRPPYTVYRYRPRTEGLFARIEQWRNDDTDEMHWRVITKDNVTSIYGASAFSRIADPDDERRVHQWLLQEMFDVTGNHVLYEYARDNPKLYSNEDGDLGLDEIFEQNRKATQLYIRRIYYGSLPDPLLDEQGQAVTYPDGTPVGHERGGRRFAFEVIFDYGDWDLPTKEPHPDPLPAQQQELFGQDPSVSTEQNPVPIRADRFSDFRGRFEIRTLRRCRRVLMFHHFAELGGPTLVRSTDFDYHDDPDTLLSFLTAVTVRGYSKDATAGYQSAGMPPVTFAYSQFRPHEQRYQSLAAQGNDMPPLALNDPNVAVVDLFGDGLPDVLHGTPGGFRYWRNLGSGRLDRPRFLPQIPAGVALGQPGVGFGDMGGDGQADLLVHFGPLPGFFETTPSGTWQTFRPYEAFPSFDLADPDVRLTDLTGDGLADALMTREDHFLWFQCLGEKGFAPPAYIPRKRDLDRFPDVFFKDPAGRVRLADMTGSGLNDIVLIHNGRIDYWPNLGYGHFGKRITMGNAPRLGTDFDPQRIFLADLNGTGCADLVYVDFDRVRFWFNQSGNRWSETETILGAPTASDADSVQLADFFGTGTATLLWSYDFADMPEGNYKALDLCGGIKPYVLTEMSNNMGATTRVSYAPSTRYFLEDESNGTPWLTRLPFPVQLVDKVEVIDHISKTKLVTTYKYHHGYFDGREREFRGFGRVDQFDTETFDDFTQAGLHVGAESFTNAVSTYHVPPVETRSWFHTGIYFDPDRNFSYRELTDEFRKEFYQGDAEAYAVAEHEVESGETPQEAYRALRGAVLRTEVYAHDGSAKAEHPYQVTETRHRVTQLQPSVGGNHGVYLSHPMESLSYQYERNPADPRINHTLTLEVDDFGNALRSLAISYGRRRPDPILPTQADRDKQTRTLVTYTENRYTNGIDDPVLDPNNYRTPLPSETRNYELTGFRPANDAPRFSLDEWTTNDFARLDDALEIKYEQTGDLVQEQKRLIKHVRTRYRKDDLADLLPHGSLESLALPGESYTLAFTPGLLAQVYGARVADPMLTEGGYVHAEDDADWWIPSGLVFLSPNAFHTPAEELAFARRHFFTARRTRDPFGNTALIAYDAYDLLIRRTTDPLGNQVVAQHDYRLLQPFRVTDPNGNRAEVAFDTLGLLVGTAAMGKATENLGDSLAGFAPDLTAAQREAFLADPLSSAALLLGEATSRFVYDLDRYRAAQQPILTVTLGRETHATDPLPPGGLKVQVGVSYSDGFGREIQKKIQAEPGPLVEGGASVSPRWVGNGWTIFNNKGKPVKRYEPFFDDTHEFRFANQAGVSPTLFYDPVERVVATLHADHTWEKVVFDSWRQERWDVNDTVLITDPRTDSDVGRFLQGLADTEYLPTWYAQRQDGALGEEEQDAAAKTAEHAGTPSVAHADSLGRSFLTIAHNRFERNGASVEEKYATRVVLDIEGNQREVIDALDRVVMRCDYAMLGARIHHTSMEAGERWMLNDVAGQPIRAWDSRGHQFRTVYDVHRRPVETFLREGAAPERLIGRTVYGESQPDPEARNQRGKVVRLFDQAGVVTTEDYDFKRNLLKNSRQLAKDYKTTLDWSDNPELEPEVFISSTTYDALNRPLTVTSPDRSVYRPTFNEANLLEKVDVDLCGAQTATPFVTNIDYNAKGQRTRIEYGNGVKIEYAYDALTFRLINLNSTRTTDPARLQDLSYAYDPGENITSIRDDAQRIIFFDNQVVTPEGNYTYDATYRLITAAGREHIGQAAQPQSTWDDRFRVRLPHPGDGQAMRRYIERYEYDPVGNFLQLIHLAPAGNWTRSYTHNEASLIEPSRASNRLSSTTVGSSPTEVYSHDAHGNMTSMPHLSLLQWDFKDQLRVTSRQVVNEGTPETTYYVYDATGQRVRKLTERQNGTRKSERTYLDGFEVYREYDGTGTGVTLERETLHVMDHKQRIACVETRTRGEDGSPARLIRYQLCNHLGSASLELDDTGQIISYEEYYPYGSTSYQAGRTVAEVRSKRCRYAGMERDEESGLNHHGARYYAAWLGRWTTCDPSGIKDGPNLYAFCRDNPIALVDRTGNESEAWTGLNEIKWENGHWTYTNESGDVWNYVTIYEDRPVTQLESQWETEETRFDIWSFWLYKRERVVHHGLRAVTRIQPTVTFEGWLPSTTEVISVTGSAPKEEEHWTSTVAGWAGTALSWGFGPKWLVLGYRGYQFIGDARESGLFQAGENLTINTLADKAIDTALKVGKKVIKGKGSGGGHHDPQGKRPAKPHYYVTGKLTSAEKDKLRAEARAIAEKARGGKRLPYGSDVHHRIPLEFAHLQPHLDPNRLDNLIVITDREARENIHTGLGQSFHLYAHELWQKQLKGLKNPTASEIENIASQMDRYIQSDKKWTVERLK
ncbi:RHS repeat-associated protein [Bradyrhizobium sp. AZCC 1678]|uniref:SpvB/TcaC N-terminal domain-containing protein n=1 Tax=Bradyrhizobium sp. AZCC 1678 TaxID=3117030 RepID=UPI002FF06F5D